MKGALLTIAILIPLLTCGQNKDKAVPINISLFNEATAIPFTRFITLPIHPGIQIGTEFNYTEDEHFRLFQTANISYFYHNHLNNGIGINSELGYELRTNFGLSFSGLLGIGYMHTFAVAEEFTFSDGQYKMKADEGNPRLYPSISLGINYYLRKAETNSPQIFIRYQSWAEYPYSPGFIPVMTHINFHVGAKMFIKKSN